MDLTRYGIQDDWPELSALTSRVADLERLAGEQGVAVAQLRQRLQQVVEDDLNREARAVQTGSKMPKPEAPETEAALREAEHRAEVLSRALRMAREELAHYVSDHRDELRESILDSLHRTAIELRGNALACQSAFSQLEDSRGDLRAVAPLPEPEEPLPEGWTGNPTTNVYLNFGPGTAPQTGLQRGDIEGVLSHLANLVVQFEERAGALAPPTEGAGATEWFGAEPPADEGVA